MSAPNVSSRIALVTSAPGRPFDDDLPPLVEALSRAGADVAVVDWDDPAAEWESFDLAVIRSTWDYTTRHAEFLEWATRCAAATRLVNDPVVVAWNSDKRYLHDLVEAGVNVVDTAFVGPGDAIELPAGIEFVVKPTVSAGSRDTVRYHSDQHAPATAQIEGLLSDGRTVMIQPYQDAVDEEGETALLFFGGEFSHAICKGPLLVAGEEATRALFAQEVITPASAQPDQVALAQRCLAALAEVEALAGVSLPLPYARIDVLRDNNGEWSVLEVELTEPSLFFAWAPGAAERYARVLVELATGERWPRP